MCTCAQKINITLIYIYFQMPKGLNCICMKQYTMIMGYSSYLPDRLDSSKLIVGMHYRYKNCVLTYSVFKAFKIYTSSAVHIKICNFISLFLHEAGCIKDSRVLYPGCYDMLSLIFTYLCSHADSPVIRLSTAACEYDAIIWSIYKLCDIPSGSLYLHSGPDCRLVER